MGGTIAAIWGMTIADWTVIAAYFLMVIGIGFWAMRRIKSQEDYFLGGRRFGKVIQTFASFGQATSSENVVGTTTVVSKNGAAGVWMMIAGGLFALPTMWFWTMWFRRVRLTTVADIFEERYNSKGIAGFYSITQVIYLMILAGTALVALSKTVAAIAVKPESALTVVERREFDQSQELLRLESRDYLSLTSTEQSELQNLRQLNPHREFSYVNRQFLTVVLALVVLAYAGLGGLEGAFISDVLQGLLKLVLSVMLLPFAMAAVNRMYGTTGWLGPFQAMHRELPESHFEMFGSSAVPELSWYWIAAFSLSVVLNVAVQANGMVGPASSKDEYTARYGWVMGLFLKRYATVFWGLLAMLALLLYGLHVKDSDYVWGLATRDLLGGIGYGLVGLMVACLMAAMMGTMSAHQMCVSALLTRNIYVPLVLRFRVGAQSAQPVAAGAVSGTSMTGYSVTDSDTEDRDANAGLSESHMLWAGRLFGIVYIGGAVLIATLFNSVFGLYKFMATFNAAIAASFWLAFLWRRANRIGAWISMLVTFLMTLILPVLLPLIPAVRGSEYLAKYTNEPPVARVYTARPADVQDREAEIRNWDRLSVEGKAIGTRPQPLEVGKPWEKTFKNPQKPVFWSGEQAGQGFLKLELVLLSAFGWDLSKNSYSLNETMFMLVRIVFPFIVLMLTAMLTRPEEKDRLDRFFVKMKTKVNADPAIDAREMALSYANPRRFDHVKLFPRSNWEFRKWDREDLGGVIWTILVSLGCVFLLWLMVTLGR